MKRKASEKRIFLIVFVIFSIYVITLVFPFVWSFINSLKNNQEFYDNVWNFPRVFRYENYLKAFSLRVGRITITQMYLNSFLIVGIGTVINVISCSVTGYIISKYEFKGRNLIYSFALAIMLVPSVGSLSALYKLVTDIGLYDNYIGLFILYSGGFGFGFILMYGFFKNVPWAYAEAAMIDGASDFKIFLKIMLPQAKSAFIAVSIITAIGLWNDFFSVYMFAPSKTTIAVGLNDLVQQMQYRSNYPMLFAVMLLSVIPIFIVFAIFQKAIMQNTVAGGLKG